MQLLHKSSPHQDDLLEEHHDGHEGSEDEGLGAQGYKAWGDLGLESGKVALGLLYSA